MDKGSHGIEDKTQLHFKEVVMRNEIDVGMTTQEPKVFEKATVDYASNTNLANIPLKNQHYEEGLTKSPLVKVNGRD
ncbi:hypothetical protein SLA2020_178900 [Shorea laevis]